MFQQEVIDLVRQQFLVVRNIEVTKDKVSLNVCGRQISVTISNWVFYRALFLNTPNANFSTYRYSVPNARFCCKQNGCSVWWDGEVYYAIDGFSIGCGKKFRTAIKMAQKKTLRNLIRGLVD